MSQPVETLENNPVADAPVAEAPAAQPAAPQLVVEDSQAMSCYSNFCRVTGTPEELIVDFGLDSQPLGVTDRSITIKQRVIVNYFTAKRMLAALNVSVQRHEAAFGVLETDIQKRVVRR